MKLCDQHGHRFFVADVAVVAAEGKVVVLGLCTSCGEPFSHVHAVAKANGKVELVGPLKQETKGNQEDVSIHG